MGRRPPDNAEVTQITTKPSRTVLVEDIVAAFLQLEETMLALARRP